MQTNIWTIIQTVLTQTAQAFLWKKKTRQHTSVWFLIIFSLQFQHWLRLKFNPKKVEFKIVVRCTQGAKNTVSTRPRQVILSVGQVWICAYSSKRTSQHLGHTTFFWRSDKTCLFSQFFQLAQRTSRVKKLDKENRRLTWPLDKCISIFFSCSVCGILSQNTCDSDCYFLLAEYTNLYNYHASIPLHKSNVCELF